MLSKYNRNIAAGSPIVVHQGNVPLSGPQLGSLGDRYPIRCRNLDAWVKGIEVGLLWDGFILHHQKCFDHPGNARSSLSVTNIILDRAQEQLLVAPRTGERQSDTLVL